MTEQTLTGKDQNDDILQERARILAKPLAKDDEDDGYWPDKKLVILIEGIVLIFMY